MKRLVLFMPALLLASGCDMIVPPWQLSKLHRQTKTPITCEAGPDCKVKMARAGEWVRKNARLAVLAQNDTVIKTADSPSASTDPAFTIALVRGEGGHNTITFDADCSDIFGCVPPVLKLEAAFIKYVTGQTTDPVFMP